MLSSTHNDNSIKSNTEILTFDLDSTNSSTKLELPKANKYLFLQLALKNSNESFIDRINDGDYDQAISNIFNGLKEIDKQFFITIKLDDEIFSLTKINT